MYQNSLQKGCNLMEGIKLGNIFIRDVHLHRVVLFKSWKKTRQRCQDEWASNQNQNFNV